MTFIVEYLDKDAFNNCKNKNLFEYKTLLRNIIVESDWDNVVCDALKKPGVFQVIAVHLRLNYWGRK